MLWHLVSPVLEELLSNHEEAAITVHWHYTLMDAGCDWLSTLCKHESLFAGSEYIVAYNIHSYYEYHNCSESGELRVESGEETRLPETFVSDL